MTRNTVLIALLALVSFFFPDHSFAAGPSKYVILTKDHSCSLQIGGTSVKSFRLLVPSDQIPKLANDGLIVNVHVCECYLTAGSTRDCIVNAIRKSTLPVNLRNDQINLLNGRIFLLVENRDEFTALYIALQSSNAAAAYDLASLLLQESVNVPPPPSPPGAPPAPPAPPADKSTANAGQKTPEGPRCEVEPQICVKPKTQASDKRDEKSSPGPDVTAEFEIKCKGFPPIIVSTDGKAGLKIGPLELSVSSH